MSEPLIITLVVIGSLILIAGLVLIYLYVILPNSYRKQFRDLQKRYSYLDAKLIGQDSQYIHRIEIISRTNLLYLDKYETFSRRFKAIFETEDKYSESVINFCVLFFSIEKSSNIIIFLEIYIKNFSVGWKQKQFFKLEITPKQ